MLTGLVLLLLLSKTTALPLFPKKCRQFALMPFLKSTVIHQARHILAARVTQDGQPNTTIDTHGGFSVASLVGIAVSASFTLAVIFSLSYSAYYRHAKLKLHRQFLERLGPLTSQAQGQQIEASPEATIPDSSRTIRTAADIYGLTVLMSPPAQPSPDVYTNLQDEQPGSPSAPDEAKTRAAEEDKVLGRREDIIPLGRRFSHAARDGQMLAILRPAF